MPKEHTAQALVDALSDFDGGVNQTRSPLKLERNIMARAVNVTVRNDFATHRPTYHKRLLTYENDVTRALVEGGLFQGDCFYIADNPPPSLMAAISGMLFQFQIVLNTVTVSRVDGGVTQDPAVLQHWLWQAENYVIWNDGIHNPVFFAQGQPCRRSDYGVVITNTAAFVVPAVGATVSFTFAQTSGALEVGQQLYFGVGADGGGLIVTAISGNTVTMFNNNAGVVGDTIPYTPATPVEFTGIQLPPGRMGAYGLGRIWMSLIDGRQFIAGDAVGGSSGFGQTIAGIPYNDQRDAVLNITENSFLAEGGTFTVPGSVGDIQAMIFVATLDASLGQGPLQVLTATTVFSCNAPTDRTTWQTITNPILTESLITNGGKGQNSTVSANGDILFRSIDGIRSLILARRDFDVWGNTPISYEVDDVLRLDDPGLLRYSSAIVHDNRFLMTTHPIIHAQGVYWLGLVPLNFDPISTLRGKLPSVYDSGIWSGMNTLQLVLGQFNDVERAFAFVLNTTTGATKIELWEILNDGDAYYDNDGVNDIPIIWRLKSCSLKFGQDDPRARQLLRLADGEIYVDQLVGTVNFNAQYWPDQYPCPVPWFSWSECQSSDSPTLSQIGFRPRMGLGEPDGGSCDASNNRPLREFYTVQLDLTFEGHCRFLGGRLKAVTMPQSEYAPQRCPVTCPVEIPYITPTPPAPPPVVFAPATATINWNDARGSGRSGNMAYFNANADLASVSIIDLAFQSLTSISNLSSMPGLSQLDVSGNSLTSLDVTGCLHLTSLNCDSNALTSLDVTHNPLTFLICSNNPIASLDVSHNPLLSYLDCSYTGRSVLDVNTILAQLVSNGVTGGTVNTIQTPAAPPSTGPPDGVAAKAALLAETPVWQVFTD